MTPEATQKVQEVAKDAVINAAEKVRNTAKGPEASTMGRSRVSLPKYKN